MGSESVKEDGACQRNVGPMVSASRQFAHYYSDKVVERTKWSIFVPGAKGVQRWLVPHRLRTTKVHVLRPHHRAVIVAGHFL